MSQDIAIVGIGCLFPKAKCLGDYWRNVLEATDCISDVPADHSWSVADHHSDDPDAADKTWCTRGGFLDKIPFDPLEWGIQPNHLENIDTSQLLALITAREALKDAGIDPDADGWDRDRVSCILGCTGTQEMAVTLGARLYGPVWRKALKRCGVADVVADAVVKDIGAHLPPWTEQGFPGLLGNVIAGRICNRFDLGGTNAVVDAACASSLAAVQYATADLLSGRSDLVLTGGVDMMNDRFMFECFTRTPAFSRSNDARPFDEKSDGILIGEGVAILAMMRRDDALARGHRVYAVIKGIGSSSDGRGKSIYAPNAAGQAKALRRTYAEAGFGPETVELVEAHGTGTKAGDLAEMEALKTVFAECGRSGRWVAVGSVKSQVGHTKSTAGAAGLVKAALALYQKVLPPTAKVDRPNPKIGFEGSPFYVNTLARPWIGSPEHPRRAAVSAFGFGGSNFHVALEECGEGTVDGSAAALFLARDAGTVKVALAEEPTLAHAARRVLEAWRPEGGPAAVAFVASTREEALQKLAMPQGDVPPGGVALLFPGQGSQYPNMARTLALRRREVRAAVERAERSLSAAGRDSLAARIYPIPGFDLETDKANREELTRTEWAQPAIGAISKGMCDLLRHFGVRPDAVAGHSYGELVALCVAGAFDEDALWTLSRVRGEAMAGEGGDRGTMAAVNGPLSEIEKRLPAGVVLANRNHPTQGVISGPRESVEAALQQLTAAGLSGRPILVSAAFHSPLVADAAEPLMSALAKVEWKAPAVRVYSNVTASPYPDAAAAGRGLLVDQITSPVDFVGMLERMYADGVRVFVECGPRGVLEKLVRETFKDRPDVLALSLDGRTDTVHGDVQLLEALAALAARGVAVDVAPLLEERLPALPFRKQSPATVQLGGGNYRSEKTRNPPPPRLPEAAEPRAPEAAGPRVPQAAAAPRVPEAAASRVPRAAEPRVPIAAEPRGDAMSVDPNTLAQLLASTRETLAAFQRAQERTAVVHSQFLAAHAQATAGFAALFDTHARLVGIATGQPLPAVAGSSFAPVGTAALAPATAPIPAAVPIPVAAPTTAPMVPTAPTTAAELLRFSMDASPDEGRVVLPKATRPVVATDLPPLVDAASATNFASATIAAPRTGAPAAAAKSVPAAPKSVPNVDATVLAVVAEKTGYPVEMLERSMDMEADLGIDSIKRVEIMAAVQERTPGLPEVDNERLSATRTLDDVIRLLHGSAAPIQDSRDAASGVGSAVPAAADTRAVLLDVVAEKTGYPSEMLDLAMDMEADLGIDSIKRVEIMAAVQERVPGLPELDNERLSATRTLSDVLVLLGGGAAPQASPPLSTPLSATPGPAMETARPVGSEPPRAPIERRFTVVVDAPEGTRVGHAGVLVLTKDGSGLADPLADALGRRNVAAVVVDPDWTSVASLRASLPAGTTGVVHLAALGHDGDALRARVRGAFLLAKATGALPLFATVSQQGGAFGLAGLCADPLQGGLAGLTKTLAQEWPSSRCLAIDLCDAPDVEALADEILTDRTTVERAMMRSGVKTLAAVEGPPVRCGAGGPPVRPGDLVVVSGGARGVTAAVVREMARRWRPTLLILGRSALAADPQWATGVADADLKGAYVRHERARGASPSPRETDASVEPVLHAREVHATFAALRSLGSTAHYRAVDVTDPRSVRAAVEEVGLPVHGVVHGAGVLADKNLVDKTPEQFDRVFDTKVDGLASLLAVAPELRFLAVFSSIAGRYGNTGQCDYSMANEVLTRCAMRAASQGIPAKSFAWGPWDGGMVSSGLKAHFSAKGIPLIGLEEGARFFCDELESGDVSTEVVVGGPRPTAPLWADVAANGRDERELSSDKPWLRDHTISGSPVVPAAMVLEWMAEAASRLFPDLYFGRIRDFEVVKGVVLREDVARLELCWEALPPNGVQSVRMELVGGVTRAGHPIVHYRAVVDLSTRRPRSAKGHLDRTARPGERPYPHSLEEAYRLHLFHGPTLRGIDEIVGYSDRGIVARVRTSDPAQLGADAERWRTDPLTLDSALQLMLLWVKEKTGNAVLPARLGEYQQFGPIDGPVTCELVFHKSDAKHGRFDATFVNGDGDVVATVVGAEYVATPTGAF